MNTEQVIAALTTAIVGMSGFIVYLFKRALDDKDKQIEKKDEQIARLLVVDDKNADTAKDSLRLAQEANTALSRIEDELRWWRDRDRERGSKGRNQ